MNLKIYLIVKFSFLTSALSLLALPNGLASAENLEGLPPRKVIMLIGDGMGSGQLGLLNSAWEYGQKKGLVPNRPNAYSELIRMGVISLVTTKPDSYLVPDSACAASSISSGKNCLPETLGIDEAGKEVEVFSDFAKKNNIALGLVSDTRLTHATPAAFYSHSVTRNDEYMIAKQFLTSKVDLAFSAGSEFFSEDLQVRYGKNFAFDSNSLNEVSELPALGLFSKTAMPDAFESGKDIKVPTLLEMTEKAYQLLKDKQRYFLMIESGQIDWASHQNDPGLLLHEMLRFEGVLNFLLTCLKSDPTISLMVLSDHETGGFGFSYKKDNKSKTGKGFENYSPKNDFIGDDALESLFSQKVSFNNLALDLASRNMSLEESQIYLSNMLGLPKNNTLSKLVRLLKLKDRKIAVKLEFPEKHQFFSSEEEIGSVIISNYVSKEYGVVWSTGTHTVPLIPFIVVGEVANKNFEKPLSLVEVGRFLRSIYGKN